MRADIEEGKVEWFRCYRCRVRDSRCDGGCQSCDLGLCESCFSVLYPETEELNTK